MRSIDTAAAAHALGIGRKALDNLLSREASSLFPCHRRGRTRWMSFAQFEQIAITLILARDLSMTLSRACSVAAELVRSPRGDAAIGSLTRIRVDRVSLRGPIEAALGVALEEVAPRRRGRPPRAAPEPAG